MKIAVMSDSHDNADNIRKAINISNRNECSYLFHLGDIISPFTASKLKTFKGSVHAVFGNCDGEVIGLKKVFSELGGKIEKAPYKVTVAEKSFVLLHEPILLPEIILSGEDDYVFYGHLHKVDQRKEGHTHILNPGETGGWVNRPSFFILDVPSNHFQQINL
jgi:putative phosphoesterase